MSSNFEFPMGHLSFNLPQKHCCIVEVLTECSPSKSSLLGIKHHARASAKSADCCLQSFYGVT